MKPTERTIRERILRAVVVDLLNEIDNLVNDGTLLETDVDSNETIKRARKALGGTE